MLGILELDHLAAFDVDRGIVHQQLVLARSEPVEDRLDVALRGLVAVEIGFQLVAEGDDAEDLARAGELALPAGIKLLHRAAQRGEIGADTAVLVHRADRSIKEAVRHAGGGDDFLAAHVGELIDALAELRACRILRDEIGNEGIRAGFKPGLGVIRDGHQAGGLGWRDHGHRIGRGQGDRSCGIGRVTGHGCASHSPCGRLISQCGVPRAGSQAVLVR